MHYGNFFLLVYRKNEAKNATAATPKIKESFLSS